MLGVSVLGVRPFWPSREKSREILSDLLRLSVRSEVPRIGGRTPQSRGTQRGPWRAPGYVRAPRGAWAGPSGPGKRYKGPVRQQAAYLRVSSRGQDEALQRAAITRAAAARGETVDLWFSEIRSAGKASARPELDAVRNLARAGALARLWVFKLDRVTRRGAIDLMQLVHELRRHGCQLTSVADNFDFEGPMGDVVLAVFGAAAEMELQAQRERRDAARAVAEARGIRWGRPAAGTLDQRARLRQALEQGLTLRSAAKDAGLSYGSAQRIVAADRQGMKRLLE
jgi:DNA invertase Pin-like site-specific DNA recombinase